jgi:hypothetical protein
MPHIQVLGADPLEPLAARFEPLSSRHGDTITKATAFYLNARDRTALVEALVVEPHVHRKFYILLTEKSGGLMVRLDPLTDPEKTDGVKRLLAEVAAWVRRASPRGRYGTTNLSEFLVDPPRPEADGETTQPGALE